MNPGIHFSANNHGHLIGYHICSDERPGRLVKNWRFLVGVYFKISKIEVFKVRWLKKSCHSQTLINECSISDYPSNFEGL